MNDFKKIREAIRQKSNNSEVTHILEQFHISVERNYLSIREESKPSVFINKDGSFHDFGTGEHYSDIVSLLFDGLHEFPTLPETVEHVAKVMNITISEVNAIKTIPSKANKPTEPIPDFARIRKYISYLEGRNEEYRSPKSSHFQAYRKQLFEIAPYYIWEQARWQDHAFFQTQTLFEPENDTLIVKIHNYAGELISYKRRRFKGNKWVTAKDTSPNKQCIIRDNDNPLCPIYILEGHHDYLLAILLNFDFCEDTIGLFNFIAIPTANYKEFNDYELSILENRDVFFLSDVDPNKTGYVCMSTLAKQIEHTAHAIKIVNLKAFLEVNGISNLPNSLDLSDTVHFFNNLRDFRLKLLEYCYRGIKIRKDVVKNGFNR